MCFLSWDQWHQSVTRDGVEVTGSFALRNFAPPQTKKILSYCFIARVRVVLRRIVFGSNFQRFDKSGGGHLKGRLKNCCQSAIVLLRFCSLLLTFLSRINTKVFYTDFVVRFQIDKNESGLTAIPAGYNYWRFLGASASACCCLSTYQDIVKNV